MPPPTQAMLAVRWRGLALVEAQGQRASAAAVLVAEIAGHRRLDSTRHYSLPSQADKEAAVEAVLVEI